MEATILKEFAQDLLKLNVLIYESVGGSKWYNSKYVLADKIEPGKTYGVSFYDVIQYDFKAGKNEDTFLKSFFNQYVSKYATKQKRFIDGEYRAQTKEEVLEHFRRFGNRVFKSFYYTTHYGIGMFALFYSNQTIEEKTSDLRDYLGERSVSYYNEFSEAGWAYRFVINQSVDVHNTLLEKFKSD